MTRIALVDHDCKALLLTAQALRQAGFTVTPFVNSVQAWKRLAQAEDDILVARIGTPAGTPCGVALALGGLYANPALKVLLLATEHERDYAAGLGDVLPASALPRDVVDHLIQLQRPSQPRQTRGAPSSKTVGWRRQGRLMPRC